MIQMLSGTPQANNSRTPARLDAETHLSSIEDIVADIAAGRMVVLADDADRKNEGDLIMAAQAITQEAVSFMITESNGLLCVPMTAEQRS